MLVDINLLPTKEKKSPFPIFISGLLIVVLLIGAISITLLVKNASSEIASLENEKQTIKEMVAKQQQQIAEFEASSSVKELQQAVNWAEEYPVKTVPLLRHIIALLPERGFLQTVSYAADGTVAISVQFDTSREAAYYLNSLLTSEQILKANLLSIQTQEINNETEENEEIDNAYLPRYVAQYNLVINKQAINELQKEVD
jgi:type IV pilus assembly protein PilN